METKKKKAINPFELVPMLWLMNSTIEAAEAYAKLPEEIKSKTEIPIFIIGYVLAKIDMLFPSKRSDSE